MVTFKPGVRLDGLEYPMWVAIALAERAAREVEGDSPEVRVTSATEGDHGEVSFHYNGRALDFGVHHTADRAAILRWLTRFEVRLGKEVALFELVPFFFQVVHEDEGTANEHIHVEYDDPDVPPAKKEDRR